MNDMTTENVARGLEITWKVAHKHDSRKLWYRIADELTGWYSAINWLSEPGSHEREAAMRETAMLRSVAYKLADKATAA